MDQQIDVPCEASQVSTTVTFTIVNVQPVSAGKLFALASVEIEIEGVTIIVHGIQAVRTEPAGTRIELPKFRDASGRRRTAVTVPEEIREPMGDAILDALIESGIAMRRLSATVAAN